MAEARDGVEGVLVGGGGVEAPSGAEGSTASEAMAVVEEAAAAVTAAPNIDDDDDDDPYAGIAYCVCGGGYFGDMVGCDGVCENWFHFGCVGLKRQPRGAWLCADCKKAGVLPSAAEGASHHREVKKQQQPRKVDVVETAASKAEALVKSDKERRGRADLEAIVARAKSLGFDAEGRVLEAGDGEASQACRGVGKVELPAAIFEPLLRLHGNIVAALRYGKMLQSWEGIGGRDLRSRGFAFLPPGYGPFTKKYLVDRGLTFHAAEKTGAAAKADEKANWRSCLTLRASDVDGAAHASLEALLPKIRAVVADKYKKFITLRHLIAIQPNLHNGTEHLPPHLDFPHHDGFGIVIVTIQMRGTPCIVTLSRGGRDTAQIAVNENDYDGARERTWKLWLRSGDCYVLSGDARNYCDHGILCLPPDGRRSNRAANGANESRESLNLRFGLHPANRYAECSAYREVYHQFDPAAPQRKRQQKRPPPSSGTLLLPEKKTRPAGARTSSRLRAAPAMTDSSAADGDDQPAVPLRKEEKRAAAADDDDDDDDDEPDPHGANAP